MKLAVDNHFLPKSFPTYGNLGLSQKRLIAHVSDQALKEKLLKEAEEDGYTVAKLRSRIKEEAQGFPSKLLSHKDIIKSEQLSSLAADALEALKKKAAQHANQYKRWAEVFSKSLEVIEKQQAESQTED